MALEHVGSGNAPHGQFAGCDGRVFHRVGWHRETRTVQSAVTYRETSHATCAARHHLGSLRGSTPRTRTLTGDDQWWLARPSQRITHDMSVGMTQNPGQKLSGHTSVCLSRVNHETPSNYQAGSERLLYQRGGSNTQTQEGGQVMKTILIVVAILLAWPR
jgi:hypothetical protein